MPWSSHHTAQKRAMTAKTSRDLATDLTQMELVRQIYLPQTRKPKYLN